MTAFSSTGARSDQARPPRPNGLSMSVTFGWRALLKIRYRPEQLFDITAFPVMLTLVFTYLLGGALAGSPREYLRFLLPGILVQAVVVCTMYTGIALSTDIGQGVADRFRSLPIWRPAVLLGALLADAVRYVLAAAVVVGAGLALGYRPAGGVSGVLAAVLLVVVFAFSVAWIWNLLGLLLRSANAVMAVSTMVLFPLTFGSNIFVNPHTMPPWLEVFVSANPISVVVTAVRGLMAGTATAGQLLAVLLACVLLVMVFAPLTFWAHHRHPHPR